MPVKYTIRTPILVIGPSIAHISLSRGQYSCIDSVVLRYAELWNWQAAYYPTVKGFYMQRRGNVRLHRELLNAPKGVDVDHINGNTLDNRIANLRLASRSENCRNQGKRRNNTSGFKGVSKHGTKWQAYISTPKGRLFLGTFDTPEDANEAYQAAARKYHGEFAKA